MSTTEFPLNSWLDAATRMGALPSFREVKRKLKIEALGDGQKNRILFTNLERGAGATLCALALMQSVGLEQDTTALFVDANVFHPVFPDTFNLGLMGYLNSALTPAGEEQRVIDQIILKCSDVQKRDGACHDNLKWMPLGLTSHRSNEFFASARMSALFQELSKRYKDRLVVIDGPSVLKSAEGRTLLEHVDQIVVVVNEGTTLVADLERFKKLVPKHIIVHYLLNNSIDQTLSSQYQTLQK